MSYITPSPYEELQEKYNRLKREDGLEFLGYSSGIITRQSDWSNSQAHVVLAEIFDKQQDSSEWEVFVRPINKKGEK